jgi:hypothetical protein
MRGQLVCVTTTVGKRPANGTHSVCFPFEITSGSLSFPLDLELPSVTGGRRYKERQSIPDSVHLTNAGMICSPEAMRTKARRSQSVNESAG